MIYLKLLLSFLKVGMFSIGGGYAAIPLIRNEVVLGNAWLSMSEFTDLITIAEMTPGPIAVNCSTFVGIKIAGIPGAFVSTFGCILPSCIIVSLLAWIYRKYRKIDTLQSVLACLRPTVVALIAAAGCSIAQLVIFSGKGSGLKGIDLTGIILFAGAFYLLRKKKFNPILVMVLCGSVYTAVSLIIA